MNSESLSFVPASRTASEQAEPAATSGASRSAPAGAADFRHVTAAVAAPFTAPAAARPGPATGLAAAPAVIKDKAFTATDSPCVAICSTLFDDICRGCGRTAMEVSNWVFMNEEEKKVVWTRILSQGYPRR